MYATSSAGTRSMAWESRFARFLKSVLWACMVVAVYGCSTVKTTEVPPDQLQRQIASGEVIKEGDRVTITTSRGMRYDLKIAGVESDRILGEQIVPTQTDTQDPETPQPESAADKQAVEIPIADIVSVESREPTAIGYAGAAATGLAIGYVLIILLPVALVAAAAGL